jgi:polyisoprenyl-teichoic acid--peptidoglycan teichoic acid transferase
MRPSGRSRVAAAERGRSGVAAPDRGGSDLVAPMRRTRRPGVPEEPPGPPGVRVERLRSRNRARLRREIGGVVVTSVVLSGAMVGAALLQGRGGGEPVGDGAAAAPDASQETWLLVGTVGADTSGRADWLAVMSHDGRASRSLVLYLPRSTLTELPGHGTDTLAMAQSLGGDRLLSAAVSNLLGVRFDHVLRISDRGERALFDKLGPVTIDVERELDRTGADGRREVVFAGGVQELSGARAADWLGFADPGGDEISRSVRHATFWSVLLRQHGGARASSFGETMRASRDLFSTDASAGDLERFFVRLASVESSRLFFETLPVRTTGVDTATALYAADGASLDALVGRYLSDSRTRGPDAEGRLVEILNGNGVPGIGQAVADRLVPKGFRVVLNRNAGRFDYQTTQVVVYADSATARALGDEVRAALGAGQVVLSRRRQDLVDVTIVVGRDFVAPASSPASGQSERAG